MKKLLLLAIAVVMPLLLMCWRPVELAATQIGAAWRTVKSIVVTGVLSVLALFQAHVWRTCRATLLRLDSYTLRLVKRERPVVTAGWRLCPSA